MAKLSDLVSKIAQLTGLPVGTVQLTARHLREAGLLSSGGRGPGGAEMTITDARNLLMGVAASQQVKDAPGIITMLSRATAINRVHDESDTLPDEPVEIEGRELSAHTFGSALDALLLLMATGDIVDRFTGDPFDLAIIVPRTAGKLNGEATLLLESSNKRWEWTFHANNPDFDDAPRSEWGSMAKDRIASVAQVDFEQQTRIGPMVLFGLARFIAGPADD